MRALTLGTDRSLHETEMAAPALPDDWLRIDVAQCAICGSDLHLRKMPHIAAEGSILGHEFSGWISEVPSGEKKFAIGDKVVVWPKSGCGTCAVCQTGENHLCEVGPWKATSLGLGTRQGAYAESITVPSHTVYAIPDGLSMSHAALTEPLACGVHAIHRSGTQAGDTALILGGGVIGFLIAHALRSQHIRQVVVVEPKAKRKMRLARSGIEAIDVANATLAASAYLGGAPSFVFECVGSTTALADAIRLVRVGGTVVALGVNENPSTLDSVNLITKEVRIVSSFAQNRGAFEHALQLLASGAIPVDDIITDVVPMDSNVSRIMDEMASGNGDHQVVLIRPERKDHQRAS